MYLHHILQHEDDSLSYTFFLAQMKSPNQNDWVSQMFEDQEELKIGLDLQGIKEMSKFKFSSLVRDKVSTRAFQYLLEKKTIK